MPTGAAESLRRSGDQPEIGSVPTGKPADHRSRSYEGGKSFLRLAEFDLADTKILHRQILLSSSLSNYLQVYRLQNREFVLCSR
jgi:hypothetical protein